jgi:hypothetical protein
MGGQTHLHTVMIALELIGWLERILVYCWKDLVDNTLKPLFECGVEDTDLLSKCRLGSSLSAYNTYDL